MRESSFVLRCIGYWCDPWGGGPGLLRWDGTPGTSPYGPGPGVDPARVIDPAWAVDERPQLVEYLRTGCRHSTYFGFSFCRLDSVCHIPREQMGSADLTDGEWVWPEGLAHYVEVHQIRLPDDFLDHARANAFRVPRTGARRASRARAKSSDFWEQWAEGRGALNR